LLNRNLFILLNNSINLNLEYLESKLLFLFKNCNVSDISLYPSKLTNSFIAYIIRCTIFVLCVIGSITGLIVDVTGEVVGSVIKGAILNAGDVHVFDMGEPIPLSKIVENFD
jgi:hypothetical protein